MNRFTITTLASIGLSAHVSAQPYEIVKYTIDGGGGTSTGGSFALSGTIGQHDASGSMTGGAFLLTGGFWAGETTPGTRLCADQNGDGLVTPADFTAWIANYNASDLKADTNQDGLVTPADFTAWIAAFNQGLNGPTCMP